MVSLPRPPVVLAYGVGVDSTALLIERYSRGEPIDLVLTADTTAERPATYDYLNIIGPWMEARGIRHEVVSYTTKRFKHWPRYAGLTEMALTNGTLPSKSLGGSSCSLKYKKAPQDAFLSNWQPAIDAWSRGQRVTRLIGYDAEPRDKQRANHALSIDDPLYECQYPLQDWNWTRSDCEARITAEGLPVPPKSACFYCIASKPQEIRELPVWCLRIIVLMEARAAPRLHTVEGLWRKGTKKRPGRMTDFIREERLLPEAEVDHIWNTAPTELIRFQEVAALIPIEERPSMRDWLDRFNEGAAALEQSRRAA